MAYDTGYGIKGAKAPKWEIPIWIDENGYALDKPIEIDDYHNKVVVMLGFQSWCQGCHKSGFPSLKALIDIYKEEANVQFLAVQTVFEGPEINTEERLLELKKQYQLSIPFGHDTGETHGRTRSNIMYHYRTGGTPWIIIINRQGIVVYNEFRIGLTMAQDIINKALAEPLSIDTSSSTPELELEFPMRYPMKVFMYNKITEAEGIQLIREVLERLQVPHNNWTSKLSRKGNYRSYSVETTIDSRPLLYTLYEQLQKIPHTIKVL